MNNFFWSDVKLPKLYAPSTFIFISRFPISFEVLFLLLYDDSVSFFFRDTTHIISLNGICTFSNGGGEVLVMFF